MRAVPLLIGVALLNLALAWWNIGSPVAIVSGFAAGFATGIAIAIWDQHR